ncbi:AlpA family phage regulatory protein [Nostoc sp. NIES-2111]
MDIESKDHRDGSRAPPGTALLRVDKIVSPAGILPIARSTWWKGVADGRYPKPVKLGPRITAWRADDIRALLDGVEEEKK